MSRTSSDVVRTARQWEALTRAEKAARRRVLDAISISRDEGVSLTSASKRAGTTVSTVRRFAAPALRRDARGRIVAKPSDRLFRRLSVFTTKGVKHLDFTDSRVTSVVGRHWNAIGQGLNTGDWGSVAAFKGERVRRYTLETEPDTIEAWARRGELDFEDIYELTT
jgi:hypothetical protein